MAWLPTVPLWRHSPNTWWTKDLRPGWSAQRSCFQRPRCRVRRQGFRYHSRSLASFAPSDMARNLAQTTSSCPTREPMPLSVLVWRFSRPTMLAYLTIRSATSSGCSTRSVECEITPGMSIFPSGSFNSSQTWYSCSCLALAASMLYCQALILIIRSAMCLSSMSFVCGRWPLPQKAWNQMRSSGSSAME